MTDVLPDANRIMRSDDCDHPILKELDTDKSDAFNSSLSAELTSNKLKQAR